MLFSVVTSIYTIVLAKKKASRLYNSRRLTFYLITHNNNELLITLTSDRVQHLHLMVYAYYQQYLEYALVLDLLL